MSGLIPILAVISGDALIHLVIVIVVVGLVFWLLDFLITKVAPPEPFFKIAKIILIVAAVLFLVNALLQLIGHPIFSSW